MGSEEQKQAAAEFAAGLVKDDMIVGLGSGTTSERLVHALGKRYEQGLRFQGVPTSPATEEIARSYGIPLLRLDQLRELDLTIDGADEVDPALNLIKGRGGALVREKLVATAAKHLIIMVDRSKLVDHLGEHAPVPVEVLPFGWTTTQHRLESLGLTTALRGDDGPYVTSNSNYILDCHWPPHLPAALESLGGSIKLQTGVVDHGFFLNLASMVIVGQDDGKVEVLKRGS